MASAITEAQRLGCETIQIFSGNPNAWRDTALKSDAADSFRAGVAALNLRPVVLHTIYLVNLASANELTYRRSIDSLTSALERARALGAEYVVTHIGSHGGSGFEIGVGRIVDAIAECLARSPGSHMLLLEAGSGSGNSIGSKFDELARLLSDVSSNAPRLGIALDTAHMWGAGYDISSPAGLNATLADFDRTVGFSRLHLVHCNDTKVALGSHLDRHWHIGEGNVGLEGFRALVNHEALAEVAGILETPMDEPGWDERNIATIKSLRKSSTP